MLYAFTTRSCDSWEGQTSVWGSFQSLGSSVSACVAKHLDDQRANDFLPLCLGFHFCKMELEKVATAGGTEKVFHICAPASGAIS